jgi:CRISPR-associated protein Csm4
MTVWKLVRLDFQQNSAHFGELGIGLEETNERVRSDTLFSAWITSYARLFGQEAVTKLLDSFQNSYPFHHSSTFLYCQRDGKYLYYLPKPLYFPKNYPIGKDLDFTKVYKKLRYLPLSVWKRWYQEGAWNDRDQQELTENPSSNFDYGKTHKIHRVPRVAIARLGGETNFYHTGFVKFERSAGLYFLLQLTDMSLERDLQAALHFLGEEGLGGERSSGAGRFKVEWLNLPEEWRSIVEFSGGQYHTLMSLFWDEPRSLGTLDNAYYEIQERGGWVSSPVSGHQLRRKKVRMFGEGSIFSFQPRGKLADVTPDGFRKIHPVYRSGISLSFAISIASLDSDNNR